MENSEEKFGYKGGYGLELIIDLKGCDLSDNGKEKLNKFFIELCDLIKMKRHGDPIFWEDHSDIPHLRGTSGIQFIETSNIVCHPLPMLHAVYLNIFSCKEFDADIALEFCKKFWGATSENHTVVPRT
ncbi:MAG: S-adenosylmethionine decarboxylase [Patescibacteria group bacterium]